MSVITVWQRFVKAEEGRNAEGVWEHNHISDGYDPEVLFPTPHFPEQERNWKGGVWRAFEAFLVDGLVIRPGSIVNRDGWKVQVQRIYVERSIKCAEIVYFMQPGISRRKVADVWATELYAWRRS